MQESTVIFGICCFLVLLEFGGGDEDEHEKFVECELWTGLAEVYEESAEVGGEVEGFFSYGFQEDVELADFGVMVDHKQKEHLHDSMSCLYFLLQSMVDREEKYLIEGDRLQTIIDMTLILANQLP